MSPSFLRSWRNLVYAMDLKSIDESHVGSSPTGRTKRKERKCTTGQKEDVGNGKKRSINKDCCMNGQEEMWLFTKLTTENIGKFNLLGADH